MTPITTTELRRLADQWKALADWMADNATSAIDFPAPEHPDEIATATALRAAADALDHEQLNRLNKDEEIADLRKLCSDLAEYADDFPNVPRADKLIARARKFGITTHRWRCAQPGYEP